MVINSVNFTNNSFPVKTNPAKNSAVSFKASHKHHNEEEDVFVVRERKPSFWQKYRGLIGGFVGMIAGDVGGNMLFNKHLENLSGGKRWLISMGFALAGSIVGTEVAERIGN
jgi:hypothetical protein